MGGRAAGRALTMAHVRQTKGAETPTRRSRRFFGPNFSRMCSGLSGGLLLAFFISGGASATLAQVKPASGASGAAAPVCRADLAFVQGAGGKPSAQFHIEIADDAAERAQGLMHRETLPASAGMLFIYPEAAPRAFWMKNTLIPLDIMFFDSTGTLLNTVANARPMREDPLPSNGDAQYVLEIQGGLAAKLGLKRGAALRHPAIDPDLAALPCQ